MIRNYVAAGVDGIMFWEDWGTRTQPLIGPQMWQHEYFPRFERLCGIAHDLGIKVFMHSCGQIEAIVPGLIEAGSSPGTTVMTHRSAWTRSGSATRAMSS